MEQIVHVALKAPSHPHSTILNKQVTYSTYFLRPLTRIVLGWYRCPLIYVAGLLSRGPCIGAGSPREAIGAHNSFIPFPIPPDTIAQGGKCY